jgi:hypothetical protein
VARALIGYTGFVGSTLRAQTSFDDLYRSDNIESLAGRAYDWLVCAGAPAAKWKANQDAAADLANLQRLIASLRQAQAAVAVLVSTVDVYPVPVGVDEATPVDASAGEPYGRNRLRLERAFVEHFPAGFVIRLPGLFGRGLRKNFIFDLLSNRPALPLTDWRSVFQFYDMSRLWSDVRRVVDSGVPLVNFATEPVSAADVARRCFGEDFRNETPRGPVRYDMRTRHAAVFGAHGPYMAAQREVIDAITAFVRGERAAATA